MSGGENGSSYLNQPVSRGSVVHMVLDRIRIAMMNKELSPGSQLPSESELARSFGVGKTSVREAIRMLEAVGVVDVRQGRGTVIREEPGVDIISPMVFRLLLQEGGPKELLELRMLFEPAWTVLASEKATAEDIAAIRQSIELLEGKITENTQTAADDLEFHKRIVACTRNAFIITIGNTILELFSTSIERSMHTIPDQAVKDHWTIFGAFASGDRNLLRKAVEDSYKGWLRSLAETQTNRPNGAAPQIGS